MSDNFLERVTFVAATDLWPVVVGSIFPGGPATGYSMLQSGGRESFL